MELTNNASNFEQSPESCGCTPGSSSCGGCSGCGSSGQNTMTTAPLVLALGVFDGVHKGHRELIAAMKEDAQASHAIPLIGTFEVDPAEVFGTVDAHRKLMSNNDRALFLHSIAGIAMIPFDEEFSHFTPEEFVDFLYESLPTLKSVHVGENFKFGANAQGDVHDLYKYFKKYGVTVYSHELYFQDSNVVTSSRIRSLVEQSRLTEVNALMGRPLTLRGKVVHGRGDGGRIVGFPTVNLDLACDYALPLDGVYSGYIAFGKEADLAAFDIDGNSEGRNVFMPTVICVGSSPTFAALNAAEASSSKTEPEYTWNDVLHEVNYPDLQDAREPGSRASVEAHVIDQCDDYYDKPATLVFIKRLRANKKFNSTQELNAQIAKDVERAKKMLPVF